MAIEVNVRAREAIDDAVMRRLDRAGKVGVGLSRAITPVSNINYPGYVHMIQKTRHEVSRVPMGWRLRIGNSKYYSPYVHEGTRYQHPQPFLTPIVRMPTFKAALGGG
jgi:hypothetical protein